MRASLWNTAAHVGQSRTLTQWLVEYGESHENPTNKLLHWICVPLIVLALMGMVAAVPFPGRLAASLPWLDWASLAALAAVGYYLTLSRPLAFAALLVFIALLAVVHGLAALSWPVWLSSLVIFVLAWIGQFVGHAIEGKRPSFFKDLQFLLIGPLWLLAAAFRRLGLRY
jgi:uncharacterized membrane protein YGL010W